MTPGMTEFWTPQPAIVTPGDITTNSAPSDAVVLFDGKNLDAWVSARGGEAKWPVHDGVYLQDKYEIQILDCYQNETYANGQTGSVYKQVIPLANAMRKPGEWNVYDIIYTAPIFNEDGTYRMAPVVTVIQNGIVLLNNFTIRGTTEYIGHPQVIPHGDGPLRLQAHGDPSAPISFRNIWLRKM